MFQIIFGMIIGSAITVAALNPADAKQIAVKSVDVISRGYNTGVKMFNETPEIHVTAPKLEIIKETK